MFSRICTENESGRHVDRVHGQTAPCDCLREEKKTCVDITKSEKRCLMFIKKKKKKNVAKGDAEVIELAKNDYFGGNFREQLTSLELIARLCLCDLLLSMARHCYRAGKEPGQQDFQPGRHYQSN